MTNLTSTFKLSFNSTDPARPTDPATLHVEVSGPSGNEDWTSRFSVTANQASYTPSKPLIAGPLTLTASISDAPADGSIPETASLLKPLTLVPRLTAIAPAKQEPGLEITVSAQGLDPRPEANAVLFWNFTKPAPFLVRSSFNSVDVAAGTGRVKVPADALTGYVYVEVNGVRSANGIWLTVVQPMPICGTILKRLVVEEGTLAEFDNYRNNIQPGCVARPSFDPGGPSRAIVLFRPDGVTEMLESSFYDPFSYVEYRMPKTVARDPLGHYASLAVIAPLQSAYDRWKTRVKYRGIHYWVDNIREVETADFDKLGNLWILDKDQDTDIYRLWVVRNATDIAIDGSHVEAELMLDDVFTGNDYSQRQAMAISCDGYAYVSISHAEEWPVQTWWSILKKIDIKDFATTSPSIVAETPKMDMWWIDTLSTSCHNGSVIGVSEFNNDGWATLFELTSPPRGQAQQFNFPETRHFEGYMNGASIDPDGSVIATSWESYAVVHELEPCTGDSPVLACEECSQSSLLRRSLGPDTSCPLKDLTVIVGDLWRAQKDPSKPIMVQLSGPEDLADPKRWLVSVGVVEKTTSQPIPATVTWTSSKTPGRYDLTWDGPWVANINGQQTYLKPAEYSVTMKAIGPSRTLVATHDVVIAEVAKVEFVPVANGARLGTNPNGGGGTAAFPDGLAPGDAYHPEVGVQVTIEPALASVPPGLSVFVRVIDVDDPSSAVEPIDDDKPSVKTGKAEDNYGQTLQPNGPLMMTALTETLPMQVSTFQGANYRVIASTYEGWLDSIRGVPSSQDGGLERKPVAPSTAGASLDQQEASNMSSELLTTWRILHVEPKRMEPTLSLVSQRQLQVNGLATSAHGKELLQLEPAEDAGADGDSWKGAWLRINPSSSTQAEVEPPDGVGLFDVDSAETTTGKKVRTEIHVTRKLPKSAASAPYFLRDDELSVLTSASVGPLLDRARDVFATAYILIQENTQSAGETKFVRNTDKATFEAAAVGDPSLQGEIASPEYWNIPFLLAFETRETADHDPTEEVPSFGETFKTRSSYKQPLSAIYLENIRDWHLTETDAPPSVSVEEHNLSTATHELLHAMGHSAHDGGIMCGAREMDARDPWRARMTPAQQARLRTQPAPDMVDDDPKRVYCESTDRNEWYTNEIDCCPQIRR